MKRKSTLELLKDKSGAALITVLVIFLTLVVIVTSATMMAHANFMRAQKTANFSSAYYVADYVKAEQKAAFVHIDYGRAGYDRKLDGSCYLNFNRNFYYLCIP